MTEPNFSDAAIRALMSAAVDETLAFFDAGVAGEPYAVASVDQATFQVAYPLACHAIENVRAARALIRDGLVYPAQANARVAYEHAVTVQWMLTNTGAAEAVVTEMKRQQRTDLVVFDSSDAVVLPPELRAVVDADPPKSVGPARSFQEMCDLFGTNPRGLYWRYRLLSDAVHPSLSTVSQHLEADVERGVHTLNPHSSADPDAELLHTMAQSAVWAVAVLETLRLNQPRLAALVAIASSHRLPLDLAQQ